MRLSQKVTENSRQFLICYISNESISYTSDFIVKMANLKCSVLFVITLVFASKNVKAFPTLFEDDNDVINAICEPSEDGLPVFIPHPYECNKYFECQLSFN